MRSAESNPWVHNPSTSTALSDTRSVTNENTSKWKEAENSESEQWSQASRVKPLFETQFQLVFFAMFLESTCASPQATNLSTQVQRSIPPRLSKIDYKPKRWIHLQNLSKTANLEPKIGGCRTSNSTQTMFGEECLLIERLLMPINAINYLRPFHEPKRFDLPPQTERQQWKESEQEKVRLTIFNIADHRPKTTFGKQPLESRRKSRASNSDLNVHEKSHCELKEEKHQLLISEFGEIKIQRQSSISERDPEAARTEDLQRKHRTIKDVQNGMEHANFTRSSSGRKDTSILSTEQGSSEVTCYKSEENREEMKTVQ